MEREWASRYPLSRKANAMNEPTLIEQIEAMERRWNSSTVPNGLEKDLMSQDCRLFLIRNSEALKQAIRDAEKLPCTADGKRIVPGMLLYNARNADPHRAYMNWTRTREGQSWKKTAWAFGYAYSSHEAALAAQTTDRQPKRISP